MQLMRSFFPVFLLPILLWAMEGLIKIILEELRDLFVSATDRYLTCYLIIQLNKGNNRYINNEYIAYYNIGVNYPLSLSKPVVTDLESANINIIKLV